jgi:transcriptional repressor NrdR
MECPACTSPTRVLESRRADHGAAVRRRRECTSCGERFTTFERYESAPLVVVKRSGKRQPFDRDKLRSGLLRASHKRDVDPRALELIADGIERDLRAAGEISAERIGELCLAGLEPLDRGAFLQFAGTLPGPLETYLENPRKDGRSGGAGSVRPEEDARRPIPEEQMRGDS